MGLVYVKWIFDRSGIQKDSLLTGVVNKRMDLRREWYTEGNTLGESGMQKNEI